MPEPPRSRAVLIGTAKYEDAAFPQLPAAANSLAGMRAVLTDPALCGWPDERVTVESDPSDWRGLARRLRALARETDDVLLLYFVGHGVLLPNGELCLAVSDTDPADPDLTGLEYRRVRDLLRDSPAATKIVMLDCCYSGRAIETLAALDNVADTTDVRGVYTLTASDHTAHVVPLAEQAEVPTSFTGAFLTLIREGVKDGPETLTLGDLYLHLRRRLTAHGLPSPNQRGTDTADRHPFTRNPAHRREPEPSPSPRLRPQPGLAADRPRFTPAEPHGPWSVAPGLPMLLSEESAGATAVAFSPDGAVLATGHSDGTVRLWNRLLRGVTPLPPAPYTPPEDDRDRGPVAVTAIAVTSGARQVAYAAAKRDVGLWSLDGGTPGHRFLSNHSVSSLGRLNVVSLAFSPDGRLLAAGHSHWESVVGRCHVWNTRDGRRLETLAEPPETGRGPLTHPNEHALVFLPDGRLQVFQHGGSRTGVTTYRPGDDGDALIDAPPADTGTITGFESAAFSPDGRTVVTTSPGWTWIWHATEDGFPGKAVLGPRTNATSVVVGPEGRVAAMWAPGEPLRVWDLHTLEQVGAPMPFSGQTKAVAFAPDGASLVVGDAEWAVRLWRPG
ncbi:caspase, EACC1-associated type [Actinomadura gamaensis]|uniref:Caspase family protein n=1 Tax=Actinomadura gamaensis TaxID=1763541 RepID=A0ABV9UAE7_9ACTN